MDKYVDHYNSGRDGGVGIAAPKPRTARKWRRLSRSAKRRILRLRIATREYAWLVVLVGICGGLYYSELSGIGTGLSPAGSKTGVRFQRCDAGFFANCVLSGDNIRLNGKKIRLVDIDAPDAPALCAKEAALAANATSRLQALLNEGPFKLYFPGPDKQDRYGRQLRIVMRDGRSLGESLVKEGLARPWSERYRPWCP